MRNFIDSIKDKAKKDHKTIVLPEGEEDRILQAAEKIKYEDLARIVLIGDSAAIEKKRSNLGINLDGVTIIDPSKSEKLDEYATTLYNLRKEKGLTKSEALKLAKTPMYYGTLMVHLGEADGLVSGSTHSTADTIRPALQIIKTDSKEHKVSSFFFMILQDRLMLFADSAVQIDPTPQDLANIAIDTAKNAERFDIKPKVAMLSFSTHGSAKHEQIDKVTEALKMVRHKAPQIKIDGELQVDAAIVPQIAAKKCKHGDVLKGDANVLIFPDLQSGNIAYKLVERLAKASAVGPILQGLKKPVNDLSRGCSVENIVDVVAITAVEAQK
ncbi:phosphate acetyltransferase [Candidatus Woesearchaeota archaeon]|nr:phosphate acetyltransferase [Candidatus Woesearchaeota archaeon]